MEDSMKLEILEDIAKDLYEQLTIADSCIVYDKLGKHRQNLISDVGKAIRKYVKYKTEKL